eukprot:m.1206017 g.1206017  ORF g.1206017 m.1206017 type:complete len:82 (+) comp24585_c1_seq20:3184-3429(+)
MCRWLGCVDGSSRAHSHACRPTALKLPTDDYNSRLVADTSISPSYAAMSPGLMDFEESPPTPAGSRGRKRLGSDGSRVSMV